MAELLATWNPKTQTWERPQQTLDGHSESFSETWPTSGSMRSGSAYVRPTPALPTAGSGSSSLLKTPTAQLAVNGGSQHPDKRRAGGHGPTLADEVEHLLPTPRATRGGSATETVALLPTPRATDGTKGGPNQRGSSGDMMLPSAVMHLLPTPTTQPTTGNGHARNLGTECKALLPTPTSRDWRGENQRNDETCLPGAIRSVRASGTGEEPTGSTTAPPSGAGTT